MLTTAEAAAFLTERGVRVRGNKPGARTVEAWCKRGLIKADRIGGPRRGIYLINEADLTYFKPPSLGRKKSISVATSVAEEPGTGDIPQPKAEPER
jgi:hypothetical protein